MNASRWLEEIKSEDADARLLRKTEKTIRKMKVGERGYTTSWAFSLDYSVWEAACKTMDTLIERTADGWKVIGIDPGPAALREYRRSLLRPQEER